MSQVPIRHWWYDNIDYSQTQLADPINKFSETEVILMVYTVQYWWPRVNIDCVINTSLGTQTFRYENILTLVEFNFHVRLGDVVSYAAPRSSSIAQEADISVSMSLL